MFEQGKAALRVMEIKGLSNSYAAVTSKVFLKPYWDGRVAWKQQVSSDEERLGLRELGK